MARRVAARGQAPRGKEHDSDPLYSSDLEGSLYPQRQPDTMVTWQSPRGGEGVAWRAADGVDVLIGADGVMGDEVLHHETQRTSAHGGTTGRHPSSGRTDVPTMGCPKKHKRERDQGPQTVYACTPLDEKEAKVKRTRQASVRFSWP
ncbi:hypothetical protein GN244_ATG16450 [Phytophthora infestans]|uniref:Uncharacterized protein n=1 Tax=Phytophthora infestans TaxID=4787 RepID=A0A833W7E0_PHYIN|nr:hypothetical protein GN244_ATG16450 [Phytophthora infestans]